MSENNAQNAQEQNVDRKPYKIEFDQRPALDYVGKSCYITSDELCRTTNEIFREIFADYEGCQFEVTQGEPTMNLFFNHAKYDEGAHTAVSMGNVANTGNDTLNRIRLRDQSMKNGDRYYITDDGKDILTKLLTNRFYNNGKPNWAQLVAETVDRNPYNLYMPQQLPQFTKIRQIDLGRLVGYIYGRKDRDGSDIEYMVHNAGAINPMMANVPAKNFMLVVTAVLSDNVKALYEKLGFGSMGSDIVR